MLLQCTLYKVKSIMNFNCSCWIFQRGFDQQWLSETFSKAIFLGNGLVAIISGLFGNLLVDTLALGPVAPFDAAACFLAFGMVIILASWTENYGDPEKKNLLAQFKGAALAIASGESPSRLFLYTKLSAFSTVQATNYNCASSCTVWIKKGLFMQQIPTDLLIVYP